MCDWNGSLDFFKGRYPNGIHRRAPVQRVLVIYTGGTIGMVRNAEGALAPVKGEFENQVRSYPQLNDRTYVGDTGDDSFLCLPVLSDKTARILYKIKEYDRLLDSANVSVIEWMQIATDIKENYEIYDGFIVLHGTDTMAYTASALSFMLENLGKSVVITGSQIPIFEPRTDGTDNFVSALIVASRAVVPEVTVFFCNKLLRGNRTTKLSVDAIHAFISPNCPPLADSGINLQFNERLVFRPMQIERFRVHETLCDQVGLLRIFPSITANTVRAFLQPPLRGVVLQTYGSGNIPTDRKDLLEAIKNAICAEILIVNITQCLQGSVASLYETGKHLSDLGVICGYDMTPEAALTKLSYVLSKDEWSFQQKNKMMLDNLRGELTTVGQMEMTTMLSLGLTNHNNVSRLLDSSVKDTHRETSSLCSIITPALFVNALDRKDRKKIKSLLDDGADVCGANMDGRTPLHHVACDGSPEMIEFLMKIGASVHIRDRYGNTPLMDAILNDNHRAIKLLVECGSHLSAADQVRIAEDLCLAASNGKSKRIDSYLIAGADPNSADSTGRTPLHLSALKGHVEVVTNLLKHGADSNKEDILGFTPSHYALKMNNTAVLKILKN